MTTTDEPLRYELRLTDRELFRVFLFGYFKRPFAILRRFIGFAIIAFGFHPAMPRGLFPVARLVVRRNGGANGSNSAAGFRSTSATLSLW